MLLFCLFHSARLSVAGAKLEHGAARRPKNIPPEYFLDGLSLPLIMKKEMIAEAIISFLVEMRGIEPLTS